MGESDVHQRDGRSQRATRSAFDLVVSKMRRPLVPPGAVDRLLLAERLARGDPRPIVSVVAPPGYGKTTLLSQWAERNGRAFAWVSVDEADNDPKVLLSYVAAALDAVEPIDERVFDALASPGSSVPGSVVPRLGVGVFVDDLAHGAGPGRRPRPAQLRMPGRAVGAGRSRAGRLAAGAGRPGQPPLRVARLRAEGKILEIGPDDLSLTCEEASSLLRSAGPGLAGEDVAELHGGPRDGRPGCTWRPSISGRAARSRDAAVSFGGDDRLVSEYMESEFLARISGQQRAFLTRTAVLERMCGPLCEAVLDTGGSAAILAELARSNLLLVPLDRRGEWYRYHHLFRDMLLAELHRLEPGLMPVLRRRAAALVPGQRPARGGAGVLHGRRGRRRGRPPSGAARGAGLPAGPGHHHPAVVRVAGGPGRDRGTPDGRGAGLVLLRADWAAG